MSRRLLPQKFYQRKTKQVARDLLGKILCFRLSSGKIWRGRIVETEAYLGIDDPACHSFGDRCTQKTKSMYLDGGHSYVYFIYGMYFCLNIVTQTPSHPEAVLIRALEPCDLKTDRPLKKSEIHTNGPGKLCRLLGITRNQDGVEMWNKKGGLWIEDAPKVPSRQISALERVGVAYAGEAAAWPLRYFIAGNPFVSR